jgi:hypothetical protein
MLFASCNQYSANTASIAAARAEVARHGYTVRPDWQTIVTQTYAAPERDNRVFDVVRFQSGRSPQTALFVVTVNRKTGEIDSFRDLRKGRASERQHRSPRKRTEPSN